MRYWLLATLACGACFVNVRHAWNDVREYGGTDLRVRITGARALIRGINPYTIIDTPDLDPALRDPDQHGLSRCTYPPTLLLFYSPMCSLQYPLLRTAWAALEWCAFVSSIFLLAACVRSGPPRFWFIITAVGILGSSTFWRLHVERGQYYVFVVLLISAGIFLILNTRYWLIAGCFWGAAICLRPTTVLLLLPWLSSFRQKTVTGAVLFSLLAVSGATFVGKPGYWLDFLRLTGRWELLLLEKNTDEGPAVTGSDGVQNVPGQDVRGPTDGYQPSILEGHAANLTFSSLSRSMQSTLNIRISPTVVSGTGKFLWLTVIVAIWMLRAERGHTDRTTTANSSSRTAVTENRLLTGISLALVTDYFLPIRVEYADVMFLLPMALIMPRLMHPEYRVLSVAAAIAFLINKAPLDSLPFNASAMSSMFRSFMAVYLMVRFTVIDTSISRESEGVPLELTSESPNPK